MEGPAEPWWRRRGRWLLHRAIILQLAGVAAFVGALLLGERTYPSFVALYVPRQPLLVATVAGLVAALVLKRRVLVAVEAVLCLVVLFPVMGLHVSTASAPSRPERAVRLATYNVFFGKGGRPQLLDELAAMAADVDVLAVQAAYDSLGARLRERLPDRTIRQDGELILVSRFPVVGAQVPEWRPEELKPMYAGYVLDTPQGPLRVFVTHPFSPRNALVDRDEAWTADVARREAQVAGLIAATRQPGPPLVIAGDTNLPPMSAIARRHFGHLDDAFEQAGTGLGYTFPAKRPWMRIDRVFGGPEVRFTSARVGPKGASDHRPVFVTFERR